MWDVRHSVKIKTYLNVLTANAELSSFNSSLHLPNPLAVLKEISDITSESKDSPEAVHGGQFSLSECANWDAILPSIFRATLKPEDQWSCKRSPDYFPGINTTVKRENRATSIF